MTIAERIRADVTILDISGRITVQDGVAEFRAAVRQLLQRGRLQLLVNVDGVSYIDSTALGEIVRLYTTATQMGGALKLLHVHGRVRDLLLVAHLLRIFAVFDTEAEALASFPVHS
jgi:anti-sigma B factor antagonist